MISIKRFYFRVCLLAAGLFFAGCQQEREDIAPLDEEKVIKSDDALIDLIRRVTIFDGSADDLLDQTHCFSVVLPVSITIDEEVSLNITSSDDFQELRNILILYDLEPEDITFEFPIQVIQPDHTIAIISNEDELDDLMDSCEEEDEDIECVDFIYPLTVSVYDPVTESADKLTFGSDSELHAFVLLLNEETVLTIDFPVSMYDYVQEEIVITSVTEMKSTIATYEDTCDENDEIDFEDENGDMAFVSHLTTGSWFVTQYYDDGDLINLLDNQPLAFHSAQTIASEGKTVGDWQTLIDDGMVELDLNFASSSTFDILDQRWTVIRYDSARIVLTASNSGNDAYLVLERSSERSPDELDLMLTAGQWYIFSYQDEDNEQVEDFSAFTFTFQAGSVQASSDEESSSGNWFSVASVLLVLEFEDSSLDELDGSWQVDFMEDSRLLITRPEEGEQIELRKL